MNEHETLTQCEQCGAYDDYRTMVRVDAQGQESEEGRVLCLSCQKRQQFMAFLQCYPNLVTWITQELRRSLDDVQRIEFEQDMEKLPFEVYRVAQVWKQDYTRSFFTLCITFTDGTTIRRITRDTSLLTYREPQPEPEIIVLDLRELTKEQRARYLDAAVAEHVMKLHVENWTRDRYPDDDYNYHIGHVIVNKDTLPMWEPVPRYSMNMDAAWLVYKEMRKQGKNAVFEEALMTDIHGDNRYGDEMYPAQRLFDIIDTWTPERICLAALQACHVEVVEETEHSA